MIGKYFVKEKNFKYIFYILTHTLLSILFKHTTKNLYLTESTDWKSSDTKYERYVVDDVDCTLDIS